MKQRSFRKSPAFYWAIPMFIVATFTISSCNLFRNGSQTNADKGKKIPSSYSKTATPISNQEARKGYIERFKNIAVSEMERTGVPASIKLAQGILESDAGRSLLSSSYNNHFGIKCHSDWQGERYYQEDDDTDPLTGQLIKSCFRAYKNPDESFIAHSEFLRDPRKVNRYGFLFQLPKTDYVAWAQGLQSSGYATANDYSDKLVRIIEDLQLSQYDNYSLKDVANNTMNGGNKPSSGTRPNDDFPVSLPSNTTNNQGNTANNNSNSTSGWIPNLGNSKPDATNYPKPADTEGERNNAKYARAYGGMTAYELAGKYGTSISNLQEYNEELPDPRDVLPEGTVIYLQKKRNYWRGSEKSYRVKECETMYDIAQKFGVKLSKLYSKNEMREGEQPAVGQSIMLRRGWFEGADKPALRDTFGEWRRCKMPPATTAPVNPNVGAYPPVKQNNGTGIGFEITPNGTQTLPNNSPTYYPPQNPSPNNNPTYYPPQTSSPSSYPVEVTPSYPSTNTYPSNSYPSTTTTYPSNTYPSTTTTYPSNTYPSTTTTYPQTNTNPPRTTTNPSTTSTSQTTAGNGQYHTVAKSETLWAISRLYGLSVDKLKQLNGLTDNIIKPGQQLRVK